MEILTGNYHPTTEETTKGWKVSLAGLPVFRLILEVDCIAFLVSHRAKWRLMQEVLTPLRYSPSKEEHFRGFADANFWQYEWTRFLHFRSLRHCQAVPVSNWKPSFRKSWLDIGTTHYLPRMNLKLRFLMFLMLLIENLHILHTFTMLRALHVSERKLPYSKLFNIFKFAVKQIAWESILLYAAWWWSYDRNMLCNNIRRWEKELLRWRTHNCFVNF
jgi:hypothetical protein